jgi:hypothetical protein
MTKRSKSSRVFFLSFGLLDSGGADNREEGLIDRCDLVFLAKAKDGDYHQEMNGPTFLNWFENQLMPALKITPINQTLLTIISVQNNQPFTFS